MDISTAKLKLLDFMKKYKYVVLVVLIGIILLLLPANGTKRSETQAVTPEKTSDYHIITEELSQMLSKVKGAGKVQLFLMTAEGEETIYQTNEELSEETSGKSLHTQTVVITDAERNERGLIKKINPPKYSGAIIVCEGADDSEVQLMLIRAVANVTGLGTNKISVLKMK